MTQKIRNHFKRLQKPFMPCVLLLLVSACVFLAHTVEAQGNGYLRISVGGMPVSGNRPIEFEYLAGSSAECVITVVEANDNAHRVELFGRPIEWPQGLDFIIQAGDGTDHPEWFGEMHMYPYLPWLDAKGSPGKRGERKAKPGDTGFEKYHFMFTIPSSAADKGLMLAASFNHPEFGVLETPRPERIRVRAPQTAEDEDFILGTTIYYTREAGRYERAVALADSAISRGYSGLTGLAGALSAAIGLENYEAAIRFLDLSMAANGTFYLGAGNQVAPGKSKDETRRILAQRHQAEYERLRAEFAEKASRNER